MTWLPGWRNRIKLSIDSSKVSETLTDFPIYINLSSDAGINSADLTEVFDNLTADSKRKRIAITTMSGPVEIQCPVEIESWDDSSEQAHLWVKVPTVSSGVDTDLYLYYDNDHSDNTSYVGDTGDISAQDVWDDNFVGVWHMSQDPSGGSNSILDSTSNGNHGTSTNMESSNLQDILTRKGLKYNGSDEYVNFGNDSSLNLTSSITVEGIIELSSNSSHQDIIAKHWNAAGGSFDVLWFVQYQYVSDIVQFGVHHSDSNLTFIGVGNGSISVGTPCYFTFTHDTTDGVIGYYNGDYGDSDSYNSALQTSSDNLYANSLRYNGTNYNRFSGKGTEHRISSTTRSPGWIKTTYYSSWDNLITYTTASRAWYFDGYVYEQGSPVVRQLYLYNRDSGYLMNSTTSSGNGYYYLETTYSGSHYIVCLDDAAGEDYNDLIIGNVYPTTISG